MSNIPAGVPDPGDLPEMAECPDCNGAGVRLEMRPYRDVCPTDRGDEIREGVESEEIECETCNGSGLVDPEPPDFEDKPDRGD